MGVTSKYRAASARSVWLGELAQAIELYLRLETVRHELEALRRLPARSDDFPAVTPWLPVA